MNTLRNAKTLALAVLAGLLWLGLVAAPGAAQDDPTPTPNDRSATPAPDAATTPQEYVPGDYVGGVVSGEALRGYYMHLPPAFDGETPLPLVLSFHGFTADPIQHAERTGWSAVADAEDFIVVYPAGQRNPMGWYTQTDAVAAGWLDDVQFTRDLLVHLQERLPVDPARIYLTGFSNGAGMIHRLACDLSDQVAALAPVAGPHFRGDPCDIERPVPVFAIHGRRDTNAPFDGYYDVLLPTEEWAADWAARDGCSADPEVSTPEEDVTVHHWQACADDTEVILRIYDNGRHVWPEDAEWMIWEFLQAHTLPDAFLPEAEA